jgi:hypothetical protein
MLLLFLCFIPLAGQEKETDLADRIMEYLQIRLQEETNIRPAMFEAVHQEFADFIEGSKELEAKARVILEDPFYVELTSSLHPGWERGSGE